MLLWTIITIGDSNWTYNILPKASLLVLTLNSFWTWSYANFNTTKHQPTLSSSSSHHSCEIVDWKARAAFPQCWGCQPPFRLRCRQLPFHQVSSCLSTSLITDLLSIISPPTYSQVPHNNFSPLNWSWYSSEDWVIDQSRNGVNCLSCWVPY